MFLIRNRILLLVGHPPSSSLLSLEDAVRLGYLQTIARSKIGFFRGSSGHFKAPNFATSMNKHEQTQKSLEPYIFQSPPWTSCLPPAVRKIQYVTSLGGTTKRHIQLDISDVNKSAMLPHVCTPAQRYTQLFV